VTFQGFAAGQIFLPSTGRRFAEAFLRAAVREETADGWFARWSGVCTTIIEAASAARKGRLKTRSSAARGLPADDRRRAARPDAMRPVSTAVPHREGRLEILGP
jgi:hypothetical protein